MKQQWIGYVKRFVERRRSLANVRAFKDAFIGMREELGDRKRHDFIGTLITEGDVVVNDHLEIELLPTTKTG